MEHIARHGVSPEEFEEALFGDADGKMTRAGPARRNPRETVYRYLGRTRAGRYLFEALLLYADEDVALPLSARDMTRSSRG